MSLQINEVSNRKHCVNPYILSSNCLGTYTVATVTILTNVTIKTTNAPDTTNASRTTNASETTKI